MKIDGGSLRCDDDLWAALRRMHTVQIPSRWLFRLREALQWLVDQGYRHGFEVLEGQHGFKTEENDYTTGGPFSRHFYLALYDEKEAALFKLFFPDIVDYETRAGVWEVSLFAGQWVERFRPTTS